MQNNLKNKHKEKNTITNISYLLKVQSWINQD